MLNRTTMMMAGVMLGAWAWQADAAIPTAAVTCAGCNNLNDLNAAAMTHVGQLPIGTMLVVVSLQAPVSALYRIDQHCPKGGCFEVATPLTASNMGAAQLDNQMFARASKLVPVSVSIGYPALDSAVSIEIENTVTMGSPGANVYHLLIPFDQWPVVSYWNYSEDIPGIGLYETQVYVGDTVTVNFPGGWSQVYQYQGGGNTKSHRWVAVPGTLMKDGKPYSPPASPPATPVPGFNTAGGNGGGGLPGAKVLSGLDFGTCSGMSTMTIITDTDTYVGRSYFSFPCQQ